MEFLGKRMIVRKISIFVLAASIVAQSSWLQAWPHQQIVQQNNDHKTLLLVGAGAVAVGLIAWEGAHLYKKHVKNGEDAAVNHEDVAKTLETVYVHDVERRFTLKAQEMSNLLFQNLPQEPSVADVELNCFASGLPSVEYAKSLEALIKKCCEFDAEMQQNSSSLANYLYGSYGSPSLAEQVPSELKNKVLQQHYHSVENFKKHYKGAPLLQANVASLTDILNNAVLYWRNQLQLRCAILASMRRQLEHTPVYQREQAEQAKKDAKLAKSQAIALLKGQVTDLTAERNKLQDQKGQLKDKVATMKRHYSSLRAAFETCGGRRDARYKSVNDLLYAQDFENFFTWLLS